MYIPGAAPPIFLLLLRNSSSHDKLRAAQAFAATHPILGFHSSPSDEEQAKTSSVLTMIELVCAVPCCLPAPVSRLLQRQTLLHYSGGFFAWANDIYHQVPLAAAACPLSLSLSLSLAIASRSHSLSH